MEAGQRGEVAEMGAQAGGMHGRWNSRRPQEQRQAAIAAFAAAVSGVKPASSDPIDRLVAAVSGTRRPQKRRGGVDAVAMLAEFARDVDRLTARRRAQEKHSDEQARRAPRRGRA